MNTSSCKMHKIILVARSFIEYSSLRFKTLIQRIKKELVTLYSSFTANRLGPIIWIQIIYLKLLKA